MKAYIYANKCPDGGLFGVYIDDEFQDIINLQSTDSDSIVYESNDLPFGQHKIEVRSVSPKKTTLICFLYRPHLIFDHLVYNKGKFWTEHTGTGTIPTYGQGSGSSTKTGVNCTRFWLVGFKGRDYGSFNVRVSANSVTILDVDVSCSSEYESTFYSVLLYESHVFEYNEYTITVTPLDGSTVAISDLIFSQQPKDAVVIYGKDLKMSGLFFYDSRFDTYGINTAASTFQFSYCGDKFYSYGLHCWSCSTAFTVKDYDRDLTTSGNAYQSNTPPTQLQPIGTFEPGFGDHEITFTPTQNKNLYISYIFYLTYSNPPSEPYLNLTKYNITSSVNTIDTYDDYIELPVIGSKVVFEYSGSNFTLEGFLGPASGNVNIYDGDDLLHSGVPLYREENKFSWFYSSEGLQDDNHRITIVNCNGNPVYISKLCYKPLPPTGDFTPSTAFTNSESFSRSLFFSGSESFTESIFFSNSESFSKSLFFSGSESFTESLFFSGSESFTESIFFSNSELFSNSESFTESLFFSGSESFSKSFFFSGSESFTGSLSFSNSETYTKSIDFTVSEPFTISSLFSDSNEFTPNITQYFSSSLEFSTSQSFSKSLSFSNSETFSRSLTFSSSKSFTTSESFSLSSSFSHSISFSASFDFDYQAGRDTKSKSQTSIIIGVCVAILALLVIALIIIFLVLRKRKQSDIENDQYEGYEANASTISLFSAATQEEDIDTIANSHDNDLFDERMMSDEEDESDSGHYGR